jgi:glutamyl-tRNA synthetase
MEWLALDYDEGRFTRVSAWIATGGGRPIAGRGQGYRCYCSKERLEQLREQAMAPAKSRATTAIAAIWTSPEGIEPVIRFRNPDDGTVVFDRPRAWADRDCQQ